MYLNRLSCSFAQHLIIRDRPRNGRAGAIISRKYVDLPSRCIAPTPGPISGQSICSCQTRLCCIMKNWSSLTSIKVIFCFKQYRMLQNAGASYLLSVAAHHFHRTNWQNDIELLSSRPLQRPNKIDTALFMKHPESWGLPKFNQLSNLMQPRGTSQLKELHDGLEILRRQYSII